MVSPVPLVEQVFQVQLDQQEVMALLVFQGILYYWERRDLRALLETALMDTLALVDIPALTELPAFVDTQERQEPLEELSSMKKLPASVELL